MLTAPLQRERAICWPWVRSHNDLVIRLYLKVTENFMSLIVINSKGKRHNNCL